MTISHASRAGRRGRWAPGVAALAVLAVGSLPATAPARVVSLSTSRAGEVIRAQGTVAARAGIPRTIVLEQRRRVNGVVAWQSVARARTRRTRVFVVRWRHAGAAVVRAALTGPGARGRSAAVSVGAAARGSVTAGVSRPGGAGRPTAATPARAAADAPAASVSGNATGPAGAASGSGTSAPGDTGTTTGPAGDPGGGTPNGDGEPPPRRAGLRIATSGLFYDGGHSCAVRADGTVACWGANALGQLGDGSTDDHAVPVSVKGISDAVGVATGAFHSCALRRTGEVVCWGYNANGELGDGTLTDRDEPAPVAVVTNALTITGSQFHTCALLSTGAISCWGDDRYNQNGGDQSAPGQAVATPVTVHGITDAVSIAAGSTQTCAVLGDGHVDCWGTSYTGELGPMAGSLPGTAWPEPVLTITDAVAVTAGYDLTCALRAAGKVACWGDNRSGAHGDGTTSTCQICDANTTPSVVAGIDDAVAVSAGVGHACAVLSTGRVRCWGYGPNGQLGNGDPQEHQPTPIRVVGITDAVEVSAGFYGTCALREGDSVRCWGDNEHGQLGDGTATSSTVPVDVAGLP